MLASVLYAKQNFAEAEALCKQTRDRTVAAGLGNAPVGIRAQLGLALSIAGQHRYADAESELLEAQRLLAAVPNPPPPAVQLLQHCIQSLAKLYDDWEIAEPGKDHAAKAAAWRARLPSNRPTTQPQ